MSTNGCCKLAPSSMRKRGIKSVDQNSKTSTQQTLEHITQHLGQKFWLHQGNYLEESVNMPENVTIGSGNIICRGTRVMDGSIRIGSDNIFFGGTIGLPAEDIQHKHAPGQVLIGDNNVIREYVTIQASTSGVTKIGNGCYLMAHSHVGHDAWLHNEVKLACGAKVGGHAILMHGANMGLNSCIHQKKVMGPLSILGMLAAATEDLEPFMVYAGVPAKPLKKNTIGLERSNLSEFELKRLEKAYQALLPA